MPAGRLVDVVSDETPVVGAPLSDGGDASLPHDTSARVRTRPAGTIALRIDGTYSTGATSTSDRSTNIGAVVAS